MTQRALILDLLRRAGPAGLCITDIGQADPTAVLTARNRIGELRREDGFDISAAPCRAHAHRSTVSRYVLHEAARQLGLAV